MTLVRLDEAAYRRASFLDRRILHAGVPQASCPAGIAAAAAAGLSPRAHYIFHIGHVGSTLVSRLLGECAGLFSIREPAMLRTAATDPARAFGSLGLRDVLSLLSRTWRPGQRALVKTTSFVGEIAGEILELDPGSTALLMFMPALSYLRCILGGPNSRIESRMLAPSRLLRLRRRLGVPTFVEPQSEGEWIAMSWLSEMAALRHTASRFGSRVVWVDFDAFLSAPAPELAKLLRALGWTPGPGEVETLLAAPLMRRYSKAPEHEYDAALRNRVLESADWEHGAEIRRGMSWLASLIGRHPLVDAALSS